MSVGVWRSSCAFWICAPVRARERVVRQGRTPFIVSAVPTVLDPLTRLAPADDNAGGSPPSPPRGRGLGISKIERFANVETLGLRFCRRIITLNVTPPSWRLQCRLEAGVTPNPLGDPPVLPGRQQEFDIFGSTGSGAGQRPLTRPAPAGEGARRGPPSPPGEGKCGAGGAAARDGFFPLPWGEGKWGVGGAAARDGVFPLPWGEGKWGVGGATARDGFFLSLGERANLGALRARWLFPSPLGRGRMGCGGATARDGVFPLPWGEGGRGTRSGEGVRIRASYRTPPVATTRRPRFFAQMIPEPP